MKKFLCSLIATLILLSMTSLQGSIAVGTTVENLSFKDSYVQSNKFIEVDRTIDGLLNEGKLILIHFVYIYEIPPAPGS